MVAGPAIVLSGDGGEAGYVTMSFLVGSSVSGAAARPRHAHFHHTSARPSPAATAVSAFAPDHPVPPSILSALLPPQRWLDRCSWKGVAGAAVMGANACALAYLCSRAWGGWADQQERQRLEQQQEERQKAEQQEIARAALLYLQRLWDVAMKVRCEEGVGRSGIPTPLHLYSSDLHPHHKPHKLQQTLTLNPARHPKP